MSVMPTDARTIGSPSAYQDTCMEIAKLVAEARNTGRQDDVIAELCSDPKKLAAHAAHHALMLLRGMSTFTPTYVMLSKAGDGLVIPLMLDSMPKEDECIAIVAPLAFVLRLAPMDGYFLMVEMSGLIIILSFIGENSRTDIYRVDRHPKTNQVLTLQPTTNTVIASFDDNPCFMNLYELADDLLSQSTV
jgi:hypothetical protein